MKRQPALEFSDPKRRPLADRLRPSSWDAYQGTEHLDQKLLTQLREGRGYPPSLILWGPPGVGKTTLAKLIGATFSLPFVEFSAVLFGVKEVREIVDRAAHDPRPTILFVDEIHRFNKSQQDAFLPHVEKGTIILIGATTENPSFSLTGALLSRCKVLVLKDLGEESLARILARASEELGVTFDDDASLLLAKWSGGDGRRLLNLVEALVESRGMVVGSGAVVSGDSVREYLSDSRNLFYDRQGEEHYNVVSAFIKSLRGSNPDAALYWGFRMVEGGEDPRFVFRRLVIFASEDIGNADPRALQIAVSGAEAYDRLGLPEGKIPLAQVITYLASAPKSNRSYMAMHSAIAKVREFPKVQVPLHLRNAPTSLMRELSYGKEYIYPHDTEEGYTAGVEYLPEEIRGARFYEPTDRGYEKTISERPFFLGVRGKG